MLIHIHFRTEAVQRYLKRVEVNASDDVEATPRAANVSILLIDQMLK